MARARTYNRQEMLTRSMEVFWDRGYEATSIEDVTTATGVSRSSIYQAFGSKRGLFDAVVGRYLEGIDQMLEPLERGSDGLEDVSAFFERWRETIRSGADGSLGCLIVNTLAERGHIDNEIVETGDSYMVRLRKAFLKPLEVSARMHEIEEGSAELRSQTLMLLTAGVFVASRGQDRERIEALLDGVVAVVESWKLAT
ncbi:MAG: TetR/AcrR family transcriptional regulator [Actinomycetota bacterium]